MQALDARLLEQLARNALDRTDVEQAGLEHPDLALRLDRAWGSSRPGGRARLREALIAYSRERFPERAGDLRPLRDLSRPPEHPLLRFSLSHSPEWGGFACVSSLCGIGFDIEDGARFAGARGRAIARRVAVDARELEEAPSPGLLWVAKEAAFKSLRFAGRQPATISQICVYNWRPFPSPLGAAYRCEATCNGPREATYNGPREAPGKAAREAPRASHAHPESTKQATLRAGSGPPEPPSQALGLVGAAFLSGGIATSFFAHHLN